MVCFPDEKNVVAYFDICQQGGSKLVREQLTGGGTKCSSEGDANFILSQHFDNCKIQTETQKYQFQYIENTSL